MVNMLLEGYDIDAGWLRDELEGYIKPTHSVAVLAFSFRDSEVRSAGDWDALYGREQGKYYAGIVRGLMAYGIPENSISFVNYFVDTRQSAAEKIRSADIVYLPGGLPDRMMERVWEFDLYDTLLDHHGIVMGVSAGAMVLLAEYHISPDKDYPAFQYARGLPYCRDFYLEPHYEGTEVQRDAIRRVLAERGNPVYATVMGSGAILIDSGRVKLIGDVKRFDP